ncbi:MAG: hypothetical protein ABI193_18300 [Minicystis sp.]
MKIPALAVSLALAGLSLSPPVTPAPAQAPAAAMELPSPVEALDEAPDPAQELAQAPRAIVAPTLQIKEISAPVPADLQIAVKADKGGWSLTLRRAKQLVTLRRADQRSAGQDHASLKIARGEEESAPLVWETIQRDALTTTRGTVHLNRAGHAELRLAEPPRAMGAIEQHRRHTCKPEDDGFGGVSVLCRVDAWITAANTGAADPQENVSVFRNEAGAGLVRFDFPASGPGVTVMVLGYTDGLNGVVMRAEQTFLAGESGPSLTLLSDDRRQPILPQPIRWHEHWDPIDMVF